MPRTADQHLQERIVKTAHRLWRSRGEKRLTLRTIAREAGTTTVYKRFRNKEALRLALAKRIFAQLTAETTSASTVEQVYRRYLKFAERHPQEYKLLFGTMWTEILGVAGRRPVKKWLLAQLAQRFGGKPGDYQPAYYALFL